MKTPKISVIMSAYNAEKYIAEAIESILNQTFKDFEFIIINDSSTDNSLNIIKKYAKKDRRIVLINNSKNLGLIKSLNKGLKIAKGKYIARMDDDDISLPKRFQIQYDFLENNLEIFLVGSSCFLIDEKGIKIGSQNCPIDFTEIKKKLTKKCCMIHPSIMFRNDKQTFYREKMWHVEDYDLYLNLLTRNKKIANIKDKIILYRITPNSICITHSRKQKIFSNIAIKFYNQRMIFGKDKYNDFNSDILLSSDYIKECSNEEVFIKSIIEAHLKNRNFKRAREILHKKNVEKKISFLKILPYFICAYIPLIYKLYRLCFYKEK